MSPIADRCFTTYVSLLPYFRLKRADVLSCFLGSLNKKNRFAVHLKVLIAFYLGTALKCYAFVVLFAPINKLARPTMSLFKGAPMLYLGLLFQCDAKRVFTALPRRAMDKGADPP